MKKINISMGFLKPVQNFFKKYTALLPSIGIVIVALLLFFPTLMVGKGVKEKMEESVRKASTVRGLAGDVPSKDDPQQIKRYMDRLDEEATQVETLMTQSSQRELISYDVFPPKSTSSQLYADFGSQYRQAIETMVKEMNALDAPSEKEIAEKTGGAARTNRAVRTNRRNTADAINPMIDALCLTRSREISVYANPSLFSWYEFWEDYEFKGEAQALEDCWDSQIAYWIYQDIADTIARMNAGSEKVSSSPVKRLMGVSFVSPDFGGGNAASASGRGDFMMRSRGMQGVSSNRDKPNYVVDAPAEISSRTTSSSQTSLVSNFVAASLTDRKGDEDVDIVHFAFSVLVDNRMVMAFMQELCSEKPHTFRVDYKGDGEVVQARHNQITILQNNISVVDKQAVDHELYRYGKGAVMQLDLVCEYLFVRKGYDSIKPDPVKALLGQSSETTEKPTNQRAPAGPSRGRDRRMPF